MNLPYRKDVPVNETWDLSFIYPSQKELTEDKETVLRLTEEIEGDYKGKLTDAETILACLDTYADVRVRMARLSSYSYLAMAVDAYDAAAQDEGAIIGALEADTAARLSFIESEISVAKPEVLEEAIAKATTGKRYLQEIVRCNPHRLSPQTEEALAALQETLEVPYEVYEKVKLADMQFPPFEVNGKTYPLGYSLFEDDYEYAEDTGLRRKAFQKFAEKIKQYENTTAACFNAHLRKERDLAKLRGFAGYTEAELFYEQVPQELYDRQIDVITEELAPAMRKYARLLKAVHGLDKMTFADLKVPVDPGYSPKVSLEEAKQYIKEALGVFGDDYVDMVEDAFVNRRFDIAKNQGKETGGFCDSPYQKGSFILLSWNERMSDVFTMAHELGHAGAALYADAHQSPFDAEMPLYMVEAPSTMNELLLARYLLKTNPDKRFRRWVLSSLIGNTYYHNFVTHLREAWYQREAIKAVEAGEAVSADKLSAIFKKNLELFWGDAVEINEGAELTWMRQPHYYIGLYSYTYSAGLTVATAVSRQMEGDGREAMERWKTMLKAGGNTDSIGLAKLAGIDITTEEPLRESIRYVAEIVDEICALTEELDGVTIN